MVAEAGAVDGGGLEQLLRQFLEERPHHDHVEGVDQHRQDQRPQRVEQAELLDHQVDRDEARGEQHGAQDQHQDRLGPEGLGRESQYASPAVAARDSSVPTTVIADGDEHGPGDHAAGQDCVVAPRT